MSLIYFLNLKEVFWGFLDSALLTLIVTPGIYLLLARVLGKQQVQALQQFDELSIAAVTFESLAGVIVTDARNNILRVNRSFTEITGYTNEEAIGKTPAILRSGRQDKGFYRDMWEVLDRDKCWSGEIWNRRKNGEIYPEWLTITAVLGNEGEVANYVGIFSDITRRKQMEQESIKLLHRNQMLMDTSLDGIHVMDINGDVLEANDAFCQMLGYTQEEIMHLNVADWDAKWTADELRLAFREIIGKSIVVETLHRRKDGTLIDVEISVAGSSIDGHDYVFASSRDITERKRAEEKLLDANKNLDAAQQLAHIGSWKWDVRSNTGYWSDEIFRIFEMEKTELRKHRQNILSRIFPDDREKVDQALSEALDGLGEYNVEYRICLADGTTKDIHSLGQVIRDEEGKPLALHGSAQDITERKIAERQLHELTAHIQTVREEEKISLAREIHDELGSKLTALKMEAYRLAGKLSGDKYAPLLEHVGYMTQLIDNAVNVTRRVITDLRPTILDDLGLMAALEWQCDEFQKRTGIACKIIWVESKDDGMSLRKTLTINLFRIFQETLSNVARHSGASRVDVEFRHWDEKIILSVGDNGRGLPEGYTIPQTSFGIRGMRERVAQLGGQIRFDSPPGGGFHITVILPLAASHNDEGAA